MPACRLRPPRQQGARGPEATRTTERGAMGARPPRRPPRASEPGGAGGRAPEGEPCYDGLRASCVDRPLCLGARLGAGSGEQGPTIGKTGRTCPAGVSDTASCWLARESRARVGACGHRQGHVPVWCGVGGRGAGTHHRVAPAGRRNRQRRRLARSACLCELPRLLLPEPELDLTYASGKVADSALCSRVHPRRSMAVVLRRQAEPPS